MIKKKKIVLLSTSELTVRSFLIEHIKILKKLNFEVYLITNFLNNDRIYRNLNIKLININFRREINFLFDIFTFLQLLIKLFQISPNLTISISPKAGFLNSIASYIFGVSTRVHIFTGQVWANKKGIFKYFLMNLDKLISKLSTHILVDSKGQKGFLIKNKIINQNKFTKVIHNGSICGVDTNRFKKNIINRKKIRKNLGINSDGIILIYTGRLNKDKGIEILISTFMNLLKKNKNIKLLLIGSDEMKIKKKLKNKNIIFINFRSNIEQFMQASDIFCFPSFREGFGLSIIEASSCELPVVCSDIYGLKETVIHKETGFKFDLKKKNQFYEYLDYLIRNKNIRQRIGIKGRNLVKKKFEKKNVINEYSKFYKKIAFYK